MLRATGLDLGTTGTRRVSVGLLWGAPRLESDPPSRGVVVANVPSDLLTFRSLNVPPAGREVRNRVVREELSYTLPFPLDEAAWDWTSSEDVACVLVAPLDRLREVRREAGDRASLDGEPLSYLRAARACGYRDALVFDFGASRTTLCAIKDGTLDWVRVSFRGGAALTRRLASERDLALEVADELKTQRGLELPECRDWLATLLDEALLPRPLPFEVVLVCGGGAQMPGLLEAISARLGESARLFPVPQTLSPFRDVAAWGAALAARPRYPRIQLRPALAPSAGPSLAWMAWIVALLVVATLDLEVRHATLVRQQSEQATVLKEAIRRQAPSLAELPADKLAAELNRRVEAARQARLRSPALLLDTVARLAPPLRELQGLEVRALGYEEEALTVEGQATSNQQAEKLRSQISTILERPELIEIRAGARGQTNFKLVGRVREP